MKIITWNCKMAFRKKAELILSYKPDILVIPECEHPGKLTFNNWLPAPNDVLWFGNNPNKGLGVFSFSDFSFKLLKDHNEDFKTIIPIRVSGKGEIFKMFAIWAYNPADKEGQYVTQVWKAIHHYQKHLKGKRTILIGDFNSNTIWDKPRREGNHSTVVAFLEARKIYSAYHKYFEQVQGKEKHPTLYMYHRKSHPYHIDYCFASKDWIDHLKSVEVGEFEFWKKHSDHVPVIVTFEFPSRKV
jgi:exodeoxyribonuclease III